MFLGINRERGRGRELAIVVVAVEGRGYVKYTGKEKQLNSFYFAFIELFAQNGWWHALFVLSLVPPLDCGGGG